MLVLSGNLLGVPLSPAIIHPVSRCGGGWCFYFGWFSAVMFAG